MHAFFVDAMPMLNEDVEVNSTISEKEAYEDIIEKVMNSSEKVTMLFTGPLTDLAKV